jgi:ATP-binding protein involved in chromosome partitioning
VDTELFEDERKAVSEGIRNVLSKIVDPHLQKDLITAGEVDDVDVQGETVTIRLTLGYPAASWKSALESLIRGGVGEATGTRDVRVVIETDIVGHEVQKGVNPIPGVRNMIAVASGKGGVGKSTVSVNLALGLAVEGAQVGILDADIFGPSQPRMLGISGQPNSPDGKTIEPHISYNVQAMSIGFLIDEETPMIWRGPMVTQALEQLLNDTKWDNLDYLIIDLPPGTGDTQLTLAQKVPVSGALIVTTPQDIALLDAKKAFKMFEKVEIPVLGVVENMSTHICNNCGHEEHIFGQGGGRKMANQYGIDYLGEIPLAQSIREGADTGNPIVASDPEGELANIYRTLARNVSGRLAARKRDYSDVFPSIVVQNN